MHYGHIAEQQGLKKKSWKHQENKDILHSWKLWMPINDSLVVMEPWVLCKTMVSHLSSAERKKKKNPTSLKFYIHKNILQKLRVE